MLAEIRIYFEGDRRLKPGFDTLFGELKKRANDTGCRFRIIDGRSGDEASRDFDTALRAHPQAWNILLRDSEGPLEADASASLCRKHGWNRAHAKSIFWMVEMMEAWFHADKNALKEFYGSKFNENALKKNPRVEEISKKDLEDGLREATRNCTKGCYFDNKAEHGAGLLARVDPKGVRAAAPNCQKLFDAVLAKLA